MYYSKIGNNNLCQHTNWTKKIKSITQESTSNLCQHLLIQDIFYNNVVPYFKNVTFFLDDSKIESMNNMVEIIFDIAPKYIKKYIKL